MDHWWCFVNLSNSQLQQANHHFCHTGAGYSHFPLIHPGNLFVYCFFCPHSIHNCPLAFTASCLSWYGFAYFSLCYGSAFFFRLTSSPVFCCRQCRPLSIVGWGEISVHSGMTNSVDSISAFAQNRIPGSIENTIKAGVCAAVCVQFLKSKTASVKI
jgi:hypothetical protein